MKASSESGLWAMLISWMAAVVAVMVLRGLGGAVQGLGSVGMRTADLGCFTRAACAVRRIRISSGAGLCAEAVEAGCGFGGDD